MSLFKSYVSSDSASSQHIRHRSGIKVRVDYRKYVQPSCCEALERIALSAPQTGSITEARARSLCRTVQLADTDKDGSLSDAEISSGDALAIVREAGIPMIDDTADGSKGSGLMHHKFIVIDGKTVSSLQPISRPAIFTAISRAPKVGEIPTIC